MFAIKSLLITDKEREVLNVTLLDESSEKTKQDNYVSLILGENGVGKSFLLKSIIDIFLYLDNAKTYKRKPKYQYQHFAIEYIIDNDNYYVYRESGSNIVAKKNGQEINHKDIVLPNKILAIAFMVNDKFQFSNDEDGIYAYHGVRSSTNSTYTSSITRNITFDLIECIRNGLLSQVENVLTILQFEPIIKFYFNNTKKTIIIDLRDDYNGQFAKYEFNKYDYPTVYFSKNNREFSFDSCSSGEKHMLFAFLGIMSRVMDSSLVLIDEPEISLHPEWQLKYISTLEKLFSSFKNCCFILASHSHYFVSELKSKSSSIVVLRSGESNSPQAEIIPYDTYAWSAENIIYNVFGIRTTRNYYFESDLSYLILSLQDYDGSAEKRESIEIQIDKLKKYVFGVNDPLNVLLKDAEGKIKC